MGHKWAASREKEGILVTNTDLIKLIRPDTVFMKFGQLDQGPSAQPTEDGLLV